jgi:hypothetical protein
MSLKRRFRDALLKKSRRGFHGYPLATVAYYGPDDQRASKVAVGIIRSEGAEPAELERWHSDDTDVRSDPATNRAILDFIRGRGVLSVVVSDRIIGCPHEERTDYPEGEVCPRCPYWATRDRWSGKTIR